MLSTRVRSTVTIASLAAMLALTGCGSDEQDPPVESSTASSSSSASTSSSSSTTAKDPDGARAVKVVKSLERTSDELYATPSMSNGEFGAYASGNVFKQRSYSLSQSRTAGENWTGKTRVEVIDVSKKSDTSQFVVACLDLTGIDATDASGKPMDLGKRYKQEYTVEKSDGAKQDGKWRVTSEKATTAC